MTNVNWTARYADVITALPHLVADAPVTLCGLGACIDARVLLEDIGPMLDSTVPQAVALGRLLQTRARDGKGGELAYDWPEGPIWISQNLPVLYSLGGTGPHAAWVLSALGAPALLALENRSDKMLKLVPEDVLLAEGGDIVRAAAAKPSRGERPCVFIFEYTAGMAIGDVVPSRSSRVIVRFADLGLERDDAFDLVSTRMAQQAGAGLVSGFTAVPPENLDVELRRVTALARGWRTAGLRTVHLELAGYDALDHAEKVLDGLKGCVTSVGMSESEFKAIRRTTSVTWEEMTEFGDRMDVDRICIHADQWAAAVTRRDVGVERSALMAGCLVASTRAGVGKPAFPAALDPSARFEDVPFSQRASANGWQFASCAAPYIRRPKTTLGLGDTFTAGCLLVLGLRSC